MKPILFPSNATTFTTNGLGTLDCISCKVTEERNGMYEREMEIAQSANHATEIEMSSIIVVIPSVGATKQAFRVYKITKPINEIFKVYAQHISYQLSYIPVFPFEVTASASAASQALAGLKTNAAEACPFNFSTDVDTVSSFAVEQPISLRNALGGVEGSILDKFGGEFEWNNYNVTLHKTRGVQTPTVYLRYGKNITDLRQEKYISNTVTGICPFWKDSEGTTLVTLTEKVVESQYAANFPFPRTVVVDMSSEFEEQPTEAQLRARANVYINQSGIGIPTVSIQVSFVNLYDTEEYKDIAPLQAVKLCDIVGVQFEKLGINTTAKVVKTVYDVLAERYDSVEIGSVKTSLASTITETNGAINALQSTMQTKFGTFSNEIREDIDNATAWLTSSDGYVIAVKNNDGSWKELIFADHNDPADWVHCLRINENGIGFSSDGGQTYTQAWTLDGKLVIGGTDVPSLTVYDNSNPPNIIFQTSQSGTVWNSTNSSMTAAGLLTAIGATLQNVTLTNTNSTTHYGMGIDSSKMTFSYNDTEEASLEYKFGTYRRTVTLKATANNADIEISSGTQGSVFINGGKQDTSQGGANGIYLEGKSLFLRLGATNYSTYEVGYGQVCSSSADVSTDNGTFVTDVFYDSDGHVFDVDYDTAITSVSFNPYATNVLEVQ